jgi:predicted porin
LSGQSSRLFGRQAFVGLQGGFGAVTLGRQQNALYDLFGAYDPMGVGPKYSLNSVDSGFNGRADNSLKYTGKFGGLTGTGFYSTGANNNGEVPGNYKAGRAFGAGLAYTAGAFSVGTAYDQTQSGTPAISTAPSSVWPWVRPTTLARPRCSPAIAGCVTMAWPRQLLPPRATMSTGSAACTA